ncbi:MAG TPA: DUF3566 domain-containing protein [Mycobacteriales bacterium]|nr:DUF3566 domain-containing protein [Mycobacteriales bacterium]
MGTVNVGSAARYLTVWAFVLCGVMLLVLVGGYVLLSLLGVIGSVSRALAVLLGEDVGGDGVLPMLRPSRVLPAVVLVSVVLSGLWLVSAFAAVLVHNAVTSLTGGFRVRLRPEGSGPPLRRAVTPRERLDPRRAHEERVPFR